MHQRLVIDETTSIYPLYPAAAATILQAAARRALVRLHPPGTLGLRGSALILEELSGGARAAGVHGADDAATCISAAAGTRRQAVPPLRLAEAGVCSSPSAADDFRERGRTAMTGESPTVSSSVSTSTGPPTSHPSISWDGRSFRQVHSTEPDTHARAPSQPRSSMDPGRAPLCAPPRGPLGPRPSTARPAVQSSVSDPAFAPTSRPRPTSASAPEIAARNARRTVQASRPASARRIVVPAAQSLFQSTDMIAPPARRGPRPAGHQLGRERASLSTPLGKDRDARDLQGNYTRMHSRGGSVIGPDVGTGTLSPGLGPGATHAGARGQGGSYMAPAAEVSAWWQPAAQARGVGAVKSVRTNSNERDLQFLQGLEDELKAVAADVGGPHVSRGLAVPHAGSGSVNQRVGAARAARVGPQKPSYPPRLSHREKIMLRHVLE